MENNFETLRNKAIENLVSLYKMYRKGWVTHNEFEGSREMAYTLFCPERDSNERRQFVQEMKDALEKDGALATEDK